MAKNHSETALSYFSSVLLDEKATAADKRAAGKAILGFKTVTARHRKAVADLRKKLADALGRVDELEDLLGLKESAENTPMVGIN